MNINIDTDKFAPAANKTADADYMDAKTNRMDFWFRVIVFILMFSLYLSGIGALIYGAMTLFS